jgi:hypothetical protein
LTPRTREKLGPQLALKRENLLAQGGLGNAHAFRRAREVEFFGDGKEVSKLPQLDPRQILQHR